MGGRPMRPVQYNSESKDLGNEGHPRPYLNEGARLRGELEKCRAFRDYQRAVRGDSAYFRQV